MRCRGRAETARLVRLAALTALIACALAAAPARAADPASTPSPTAKELWQSYPLQASPEPTRASQPARPAPRPVRRAHTDGSGGPSLTVLLLQFVALVGAGLVLWRRWPRRRHARSESAPPVLAPPDAEAAWTAEVVWTQDGDMARFRAVAQQSDGAEAVLADSEPFAWPPTSPAAISAVSTAAETLSSRLERAGWSELRPGDSWYSRRFAWDPEAEDPLVPAERRHRFRREGEWTDEERALWRCQVQWSVGDGASRFEAVVFEPGEREGHTIAGSPRFKGLLIATPDAGTPEHVAAVRRIATALREAGWDAVARGAHWYSVRFVWRGDAPAPMTLDLPTPETTEAP
jgi:hypothetical protein